MAKHTVLQLLATHGLPVPPFCVVDHCVTVESIGAIVAKCDLIHPAGSFAVRSSATLEDGTRHSFAGMFRSFLNVPHADIVEKAKDVRESVFSPEVEEYCSCFGLDYHSLRMSVIVQQMVSAKVAGVAFSTHPVSRAPEIVIEGAWGLGEAVVSGAVEPDYISVDPESCAQLTYRVGYQEFELVAKSDGGIVKSRVPLLQQCARKIPDALIAALCQHIRTIRTILGSEVDIEWAMVDDAVFILQARPLTGCVTP